MQFRKKPLVIEAEQVTKEMLNKLGLMWINIETLEGTMRANEGDWIITGIAGEKYPCRNDIFKKTYEKVEV
jgi:hypothetical protein